MSKVVTVGIPVYKRLDYLPQVLHSVCAQDYPNIELIISDNGMNGSAITDIVDQYYDRPYRFRQNDTTVSVIVHFNQVIKEATGEYFVLLSDDDDISANYVSALVDIIECHPQVAIAFSKQEVIDQHGHVLSSSNETLPLLMSGEEFIKAWCSYELGLKCLLTNMARTNDLKLCGGFPDFPRGLHSDNALPLKLCLNRYVAFSHNCTFQYRLYESSYGQSSEYRDFAETSKQFLNFIYSDPKMLEYADAQPEQWHQLKKYLIEMAWKPYFERWTGRYRNTLSPVQWIRAAFAMPFISTYYRAVAFTLLSAAIRYVRRKTHVFS